MVPTGTEQHAGGCDQGKGAAEHCHSWVSAWSLPSLWQMSTSFCASFSWCRLGLAQQSGLAENFLQGCSAPVGIWGQRGQDPGHRAKQSAMQCGSDLTRQSSLPWLSFFGKSLRGRGVLLGEILPRGCPISHAVENPIEALGEEDQLWAANTWLFYCIVNLWFALPLTSRGTYHGVQDSFFGPAHTQPDFVMPVPVESVPGTCSQDGLCQGHLVLLHKRWFFQVLTYKSSSPFNSTFPLSRIPDRSKILNIS